MSVKSHIKILLAVNPNMVSTIQGASGFTFNKKKSRKIIMQAVETGRLLCFSAFEDTKDTIQTSIFDYFPTLSNSLKQKRYIEKQKLI